MSKMVYGRKAMGLPAPKKWELITKISNYACPALVIAVQGAAFIPMLASQVITFTLSVWAIIANAVGMLTGVQVEGAEGGESTGEESDVL